MTLPYPVDSPGYITFPGVPGNAAQMVRSAVSSVTTLIFTTKVRFEAAVPAGQDAFLMGWLDVALMVSSDWRLVFSAPVRKQSNVIPGLEIGKDIWLKTTYTVATGACDFDYSFDAENPTWIDLPDASGVAGLNLVMSDTIRLGQYNFIGRIYYASEEINGVTTFLFDGSADLAGVPDDANTFVPSVPDSDLVEVYRSPAAAGQGYITFPGTPGNYLQVADAVALDITGALTVVWRERARDLTPTRLGQTILSKAATADQFSYSITHGPLDLIFEHSPDGSSTFAVHVGEAEAPFILDYNERWLWFCLTFDTVPTNAERRLWFSENDSLVPPAAAQWIELSGASMAGAKTIFSGSSPLQLGPNLDADIGYLSLRSGGTNTVLGGTEVWRLDADNLLDEDPEDPITETDTLTPSVGGDATIVRAPTPKDTGFIEFPGTPGNYLSYVPAVGDFGDSLSFVAKIARSNWRPAEPEAIVAQWGQHGERSYIWLLEPSGKLSFYWTTDGGDTMWTLESTEPVSDPGEGIPLWVGMSATRASAVRSVDFWFSFDAINWTPLGDVQEIDQGVSTPIFNSSTPLTIGSAAKIKSVLDDPSSFSGRILEVAGANGTAGFFGGASETVERFRISSEHLDILPTATSFPAIGGTVDVIRTPYPVDFGVWQFPGTKQNYLQVPDASNLQIIDNFCAEVRVAPEDWTPQDTDRVLIRKMGTAGNYGWQFLLTPAGRLKFQWSNDGTQLWSATSTLPVPIAGNRFAKRVAITYTTSTMWLRFWTSDDGITWTKLGDDNNPLGTIFPSTADVQIGVNYWGSMTNASIRDGLGDNGEPLLDTEIFLMDQGCLNIDPEVTSFPATTGQTVSVFKEDVSQNNATQGWIDFPGTLGNYLSTPDHTSLDITGSMTVIIRVAPNDWTATHTLLSKWSSAPGNFSWLMQMVPGNIIRFTWTTDGTNTTTLDSPPVATYVVGEFRMLAVTIEMATTKTMRVFESTDFGNTWTLRSTVDTAFGSPTIFSGNAPLTIGANNDTQHFDGRISYLDIRNGIGSGGVPGGTRALWWSAESLHIAEAATSFVEETGKTITIHRAYTPTIPGSVNFYGRTGDYASTPVPTLAATTGMTLVTRIDLTDTRPSGDYLVSGAASTTVIVDVDVEGVLVPTEVPAKPNITSDVFITARLIIAASGNDQYLAAAWWPQHETSWRLYIDRFTGGLRFTWSVDGINPVWATPVDLATRAELSALGTGRLVYLGVQIERNVLGRSLFTMMTSTDGGTWVPFGTPKQGPLMTDTWPANPSIPDADWKVRLTVGGAQVNDLGTVTDAQTVTNASWVGRIQWVQMTEYPSDTVLWRFDPTEYPGTGLTFTDGFNRGWRLDSAKAITQLPPAEAPSEGVIVQRWDDGADCSFSLRRVENGFNFAFSEDGTAETGGVVDIPMDLATWHSDSVTLPGLWGWLAITLRFTSVVDPETSETHTNGLIRTFQAPDKGTGKVPTAWTEIDTEVTANDVEELFVDTSEPVTIGAANGGDLPFIGRVSHLSLREGTGSSGTVGGTERFRFDLFSLHGVTADSTTFVAATGQVVSMLPATAARLADITPTPDGIPCLLGGPSAEYPGSPPGPTLYLDPAPPGPTLTIFPSSDGPVVEITPSPPGPVLELTSPSLNRGFWPGQTPDTVDDPTKWWTQPAFTVQRQLQGPGVPTGGDYVRGSSNVLTEATAIRFPRSVFEGWSPEGVGKGILFASPHPAAPYDTVTLEWNFPADLTTKGRSVTPTNVQLDPWLQVAIVRSAFGHPTTVNDGQTIYLTTKSQLFRGGQYILDGNDNILTPDVFDPREPAAADDDQVPRLPSGRWYYYSLFFMIGQQWYKAASDTVLLPRDHHHAEHLWNGLPPYYRWLDEQQTGGGPGHLQKFLTLFGYDFDLTRELVESWQNVYHTDFTPMSLLRRVGENFGIPYESTIGDIRYRAMVAKIGFLYMGRGTSGTLRRFVSAASKCDCDVTTSPNMMLLPDDSDFYGGTGNWAGLHPSTPLSGSGIPAPGSRLTPNKIRLDYGLRNRPVVPAELGRGSMHVWSSKADATTSLIITCGDGQRYAYDTGPESDTDRTNDTLIPPGLPEDLFPRFHGIYVKPNQVVSFSISALPDPEAVNTVVEPVLLFFNKEGQPDDVVGHEMGGSPVALTSSTTWVSIFVDHPVPSTAVYCVPGIVVTARPAGTHATLSPMVHFAGGMFVVQGTVSTVSVTDPTILALTLDYPGELIGTQGGTLTQAYVLGDEQ